MDVESYLQRINYAGPTTPTVATLRDLHQAHLHHVPFENLDIDQGTPIVLKLDALFDKVVERRRGGFCYEVNGLFAWLLQELGFGVTLLSARDAQEDGSFGPEFDHLTLQVTCPADPALASVPWLADVGWGDTFRTPLRLDQLNVEQSDGLRVYRIDQMGGYLMLWQRNDDGRWERQYRFNLEPRQLADFEETCRYHQTSPKSHFTRQRVCTLATPNGRITLSNDKLIVTEGRERQERLVNPAEYDELLAVRFGVVLNK